MVAAVRPTLGPRPRYTVVERATSGGPEILDQAGVIARRVVALPDRNEDVGAMLVRHLMWQMVERVGDGAATAGVSVPGPVRCWAHLCRLGRERHGPAASSRSRNAAHAARPGRDDPTGRRPRSLDQPGAVGLLRRPTRRRAWAKSSTLSASTVGWTYGLDAGATSSVSTSRECTGTAACSPGIWRRTRPGCAANWTMRRCSSATSRSLTRGTSPSSSVAAPALASRASSSSRAAFPQTQ